jgi:hypothetical protein
MLWQKYTFSSVDPDNGSLCGGDIGLDWILEI